MPWTGRVPQPERQRLQGLRHLSRHRAVQRTAPSRSSSTTRSAPTCRRGSRSTAARSSSRTSTSRASAPTTQGHRLRRHQELAGDGLQREVAHRLPDPEGHLSSRTMNFTVAGHGDFDGHVPLLQDAARHRPRAEGDVHQPRGRRQRVALPQRPRLAALEQQRVPRHRRDDGSLRRPREVRLPMEPLGRPGHARAGGLGRDVRGRRSRPAHRLPRAARASVSPAARAGATASSGRSASGPLKHGAGEVTATMPPGATPMTRQMPAGR